MFCKKCGNSVSVSSHFCSNCGAKISHSSSHESETLPNMSSIPQENDSSGNTIMSNSNVEQKSRIEAVSINCPKCGGEIQTVDGLDTFFCMYCGNKVVLSGMSDASYDAKVRSKKIDQEERMQAKTYSHQKEMFKLKEEKERRDEKFLKWWIIVCCGLLFLPAVGLWLHDLIPQMKEKRIVKELQKIDESVDELVGDKEYAEAEKLNKSLKKKAGDLKTSDDWCIWIDTYLENYYEITRGVRKKKKQESEKIKLVMDLEEVDDMDKKDVIDYLIKIGFVNISCVVEEDHSFFSHTEGSVDGVFIEGDDDWEAGAVFYDDVEVIVKVWSDS